MKYVYFLFFLVFMSFYVHSYQDFGITDVVIPQSIKEDQDLNYSIYLSNNSSLDGNVTIKVTIISPTGSQVYSTTLSRQVASNSSIVVSNTVYDSNASFSSSNDPYSMIVDIINEVNGNLSNNSYTKYFTVVKSNKKIPIPDIPILLGLVFGVLTLFLLSRLTNKDQNIQS